MNTLSLFIYISSVFAGLAQLFALIAIILLITAAGAALALVLFTIDENNPELRAELASIIKTCTIWFAVVGVLIALTPDRKTVLMIAASEMGQRVIESSTVERVVDPSIDLLTTWMKSETAELKKKMVEKK